MQHYFIGVKLPKDLACHLVDVRKEWQLEQTHKRLPVAVDLHITLLYLGAVEAKVLSELKSRLNDLASVVPEMDITITGVSTFGNPSTPRVIYASIEEQANFHTLQSAILDKCLKLLLQVDIKPFVPHITLAKKWSGQQAAFLKDTHIERTSFTMKDFSIYAINPGEVPSYKEIHTIYLKDLTP